MLKKRTILLIFFCIGLLAWIDSSGFWKRNKTIILGTKPVEREITDAMMARLRSKSGQARSFARDNNFNEQICFLIDMSLPSGQNRFFVYNLKKDTLQNAALVTHGRCNEYWLEGRKYCNTVGCGCTSLGKYRIGNSYMGKFGLAFKLHGLDKTNDKSFARYVVLHAHACVPETQVKAEICQSDGCPTVAPGFLQQLKPMIKSSPKPVLLWIFE